MTTPSSTSPAKTVSLAPAPKATQQLLFGRKILVEFPRAKDTADALGEAEADDQHRYYLKADGHGKAIMASEWICTHLSEAVGIAAPAPAILTRANGDQVFGSRKLIGIADEGATLAYLLAPSAGNAAPSVMALGSIVSMIYAFDMFVANEDRHLGNYLSHDDGGVRRFYAFDFSRALFWRWPLTSFPEPGHNTRTMGKILRATHGFDPVAAQSVLDRIAQVPVSAIANILATMPAAWLSSAQRKDLLDWWEDGGREKRLNELGKGLADGTLL